MLGNTTDSNEKYWKLKKTYNNAEITKKCLMWLDI